MLLIVSLTIAVNATTAIFVGYIVYRVCSLIGALDRRLQRLEILRERNGAPGAP